MTRVGIGQMVHYGLKGRWCAAVVVQQDVNTPGVVGALLLLPPPGLQTSHIPSNARVRIETSRIYVENVREGTEEGTWRIIPEERT